MYFDFLLIPITSFVHNIGLHEEGSFVIVTDKMRLSNGS